MKLLRNGKEVEIAGYWSETSYIQDQMFAITKGVLMEGHPSVLARYPQRHFNENWPGRYEVVVDYKPDEKRIHYICRNVEQNKLVIQITVETGYYTPEEWKDLMDNIDNW